MRVRNLAAAAVASVSLSAGISQAAIVDLGFIIDRSGSVGETNFDNTMQALKTALNTISLTGNTQYAVSIVTFGGTNSASGVTTVVADNILLDSVANRNTLNSAIDNNSTTGTQVGGLTNYESAFDTLAGLGTSGDVSIINFATDGAPTQGDNNPTDLADEILALQNAGWDAMNIEAIGSGVAGSSLLQALGFDTQIDATWDSSTDPLSDLLVGGTTNGSCSPIGNSGAIVNPISNCFVVDTSFADLPGVYQTKIASTVTTTGGTIDPVPLPAGLPLLLAGLGAFGLARRMKRKAD
ncbi:vWA domain-containing protein [Tateyamaria sp.]|uniref:vWA domain-containing protein n=1 Tax=Tateyamaria sp. TaxID=1929288 RepID=UPI00329DA2E0